MSQQFKIRPLVLVKGLLYNKINQKNLLKTDAVKNKIFIKKFMRYLEDF